MSSNLASSYLHISGVGHCHNFEPLRQLWCSRTSTLQMLLSSSGNDLNFDCLRSHEGDSMIWCLEGNGSSYLTSHESGMGLECSCRYWARPHRLLIWNGFHGLKIYEWKTTESVVSLWFILLMLPHVSRRGMESLGQKMYSHPVRSIVLSVATWVFA